MNQKLYFLLIIISIFILTSTNAIGVPNLPNEFYGFVNLFNEEVPTGTVITAIDASGDICGTYTVNNQGTYGVLSCNGQDTSGTGTGPIQNEVLRFKVGTVYASTMTGNTSSTITTASWHSGEFTNLNLVAPPIVCGDNYCDLYENCNSCSSDCGSCPVGGGSGGGGTDGGGGGSSGGSTSTNQDSIQPTSSTEEEEEVCESVWFCTEWSDCYSTGVQFRECEDINECNNINETPSIEQACDYIELVPMNITQTNKTVKPREEKPGLISICEERMSFLSLPSLLFIFLFIILIVTSYANLRKQIKRIKSDYDLTDIEKLKLEYRSKRETTIFITIITILSLIVYFYHYFFFLCKDNYIQHLWLLALLIALTPIIINIVIEVLKYRDSVRIAKHKLLKDIHYQHFLKMVEITNGHLIDIENKIVNTLNVLESSDDFNTLVSNVPELQNIYKDLEKLFALYKHHKDAVSVEKDLNTNISNLSKEDAFNNAIKEHPELEKLKTDLETLFNTYKTKQEIYNELAKLEKEYLEQKDDINVNDKEKRNEDKEEKNGVNIKDKKDLDLKNNQNNEEKDTEEDIELNNKQENNEKPKQNTELNNKQENNEKPKQNTELNNKQAQQQDPKEVENSQNQEQKAESEKINVLDINSSENEIFYLNDGQKLKNLRDLKDHLENMSDETFNHHVLLERNDFANWTKEALNLNKEADKIRKARNKEELSAILDTF